jgi:hypothetical protein
MSTIQHRRPTQPQLERLSLTGQRTIDGVCGTPSPFKPQPAELAVISEIGSQHPVTDAEIKLILSALGAKLIDIVTTRTKLPWFVGFLSMPSGILAHPWA